VSKREINTGRFSSVPNLMLQLFFANFLHVILRNNRHKIARTLHTRRFRYIRIFVSVYAALKSQPTVCYPRQQYSISRFVERCQQTLLQLGNK